MTTTSEREAWWAGYHQGFTDGTEYGRIAPGLHSEYGAGQKFEPEEQQ